MAMYYLRPSEIHYTQDSISAVFRNGQTLVDFFTQFLEGSLTIEDVPPLQCVEFYSEYWVTSGNRRLFVYKKLEDMCIIQVVRVKIRDTVPDHFSEMFTTKNGGAEIRTRGNPELAEDMEEIYMEFCRKWNDVHNISWYIDQARGNKGKSKAIKPRASSVDRTTRNINRRPVDNTGVPDWPSLPHRGSRSKSAGPHSANTSTNVWAKRAASQDRNSALANPRSSSSPGNNSSVSNPRQGNRNRSLRKERYTDYSTTDVNAKMPNTSGQSFKVKSDQGTSTRSDSTDNMPSGVNTLVTGRLGAGNLMVNQNMSTRTQQTYKSPTRPPPPTLSPREVVVDVGCLDNVQAEPSISNSNTNLAESESTNSEKSRKCGCCIIM